jgi:hypothetical protein
MTYPRLPDHCSDIQRLLGNRELVVSFPGPWKACRAELMKGTKQVWSQYFVEDPMAVWAKGNSVDFSVTPNTAFPFFLVDDVNRIR